MFLTSSEASRTWDGLLEHMDNGYIVNSVMGAHTANPSSGDFSVTTSSILKVENGEVVGSLKQAGLSGNFAKALTGEVVLGQDVRRTRVLFIGKHAPSRCVAHERVANQPCLSPKHPHGILYDPSSLVRCPMEVKECPNLTNPHENPPPVLRTGHEQQRLSEVNAMSESKYADYVEAVQKECPDADATEIAEAFAKYEQEFYIPPQDAMRSVLDASKAVRLLRHPWRNDNL